MINKSPSVIISVLNWNNFEDTIRCVQSLKRLNYTNYEIILIDNNSIDDSVSQFRNAFPTIKLVQSKKNLGYAGGHQLVLQYAFEHGFDLFWILNNDVLVKQDSLTELVEAYDRHGEAIYGSLTLEIDEETVRFGGGREILNGHVDHSSPYNKFHGRKLTDCVSEITEREVSDVNGSSILLSLQLIKKYGFMDTSYFLYFEEVAYCYRLRMEYHISSIIVPSSLVIHEGSVSFRRSRDLDFVETYYRKRNQKIFAKQFFKKPVLGKKKFNTLKTLAKFFLRHSFLSQNKKNFEYWQTYYTNLAVFHAFLGIKGKYLEPNDFLER